MDIVIRSIQDSIAAKQQILQDSKLLERIHSVADVMINALRKGNRILWCGNGGSAADAQHLAAELSGRFYYDRPPLNSEAMHCNTSYLTAVANDYGYDLIYSRMIDGACHPGDVLVGISTSGNSKNICNAFRKAKELGVVTVAMTGATGGEMKTMADYLLNVPSTDTPRIQESHILMGHIICEIVEANMFPRKANS
ncbi:MAG: D-sedoheptulose 7-phosphate isomerase [Paludibacteraceae bacterium]|nr:D-sedoheptulose 7-phosphate isomerase [Paludibacteraceae bacterium]